MLLGGAVESNLPPNYYYRMECRTNGQIGRTLLLTSDMAECGRPSIRWRQHCVLMWIALAFCENGRRNRRVENQSDDVLRRWSDDGWAIAMQPNELNSVDHVAGSFRRNISILEWLHSFVVCRDARAEICEWCIDRIIEFKVFVRDLKCSSNRTTTFKNRKYFVCIYFASQWSGIRT